MAIDFTGCNPKHLDHGELFDAETGEYIRPAAAIEALDSIRSLRRWPQGKFSGVIVTGLYGPSGGVEKPTDWDEQVPILARVEHPDGYTREDVVESCRVYLEWAWRLEQEIER